MRLTYNIARTACTNFHEIHSIFSLVSVTEQIIIITITIEHYPCLILLISIIRRIYLQCVIKETQFQCFLISCKGHHLQNEPAPGSYINNSSSRGVQVSVLNEMRST
jgi:hypothetical protein